MSSEIKVGIVHIIDYGHVLGQRTIIREVEKVDNRPTDELLELAKIRGKQSRQRNTSAYKGTLIEPLDSITLRDEDTRTVFIGNHEEGSQNPKKPILSALVKPAICGAVVGFGMSLIALAMGTSGYEEGALNTSVHFHSADNRHGEWDNSGNSIIYHHRDKIVGAFTGIGLVLGLSWELLDIYKKRKENDNAISHFGEGNANLDP